MRVREYFSLGVLPSGQLNAITDMLECFDGYLNDARARAVGESEVMSAIRSAREGPVQEGSVGAGTGMRCQGSSCLRCRYPKC